MRMVKSSRSSMRCMVILLVRAEHVEETETTEPVAVLPDFRLGDVDDLADLPEVVTGVRLNLFGSEAGARLIPAARVADQGGVVADDQHRLVAEFLKKPQLAQRHGMAEMYVDAGRIDAVFDAQRLAGLEAPFELLP